MPENHPIYVFNNIVDKDVQLMMWPLNLMQLFSLTPRYCIKNNRIFPNSVIINLLSMIGAIVFISLYIFRTYMILYRNHFYFTKFMTVTAFVDCVYYSFGFFLNFAIGIIQRNNNVKFVLLFQRVHRFLNSKTCSTHSIVWNWITAIVAFTVYSMIFTYFNIQLALPWFYLFVNYILIVFDLNVVYAIRVIKLLQSKLELWNIKILKCLEVEEMPGEDYNKKMFQAYVDVIECYNIHKVYFQAFILFYIIEVFIHSLIYIEVTIEALQVGVKNNTVAVAVLGLMSVMCWLIKILTWLTIFMQSCETFYLTVQSVRDSCAVILMSNRSDAERRLCKNVLRLHRASFSKIRVCGLVYADVALQLDLMGQLANYSVVLLQFALL